MIVEIRGKVGIIARVIQDSISVTGKRITTFELEYPRYVHAELMTHRMFSRNAASSRAIPVTAMHSHIVDNTATPVVWQKNQPGMQSSVDFEGEELHFIQRLWIKARDAALASAKELFDAGLHKQWANRPTEAFQMMKTVVTFTEGENWYWLRDHTDAQPDIHELAKCMATAQEISSPMLLYSDEWHVPYVTRIPAENSVEYYSGDTRLTIDQARKVSASCCAQVSYRKSDDSLEKAISIFDRLINSVPVHASPVEHQATPMLEDYSDVGSIVWEEGVTHMLRDWRLCSGNFIGWIQYRQLIPNNSK